MKLQVIKSIILISFVFGIISCISTEEKAAREKFDYARSLIEASDYEAAKIQLDSIEILFPQQYAILNKSRPINDMISLSILETKVDELKTQLDSLSPKLKGLKKNFNYSPGVHNRPGKYEYKRQTPNNSHQRSYLKVHLNDYGEYYLSSNYYGKFWLSHTYVRVYDKDLLLETERVPVSDPDNVKFEDGENLWEEVTYKNNRGNGIIDFIIQHFDLRLKVRFSGKKHHYIVMETFDKQAVKEAYDLALVLTEIHELRTQIKEHNELIKLIKK